MLGEEVANGWLERDAGLVRMVYPWPRNGTEVMWLREWDKEGFTKWLLIDSLVMCWWNLDNLVFDRWNTQSIRFIWPVDTMIVEIEHQFDWGTCFQESITLVLRVLRSFFLFMSSNNSVWVGCCSKDLALFRVLFSLEGSWPEVVLVHFAWPGDEYHPFKSLLGIWNYTQLGMYFPC